jgi:hypothetical protein
VKTLTDEEWEQRHRHALHSLTPGPLLVAFAVDRIRRPNSGRMPQKGICGIRVNKNEPDYPITSETENWLKDRIAADTELSERIAALQSVGFQFCILGEGEAWYAAIFLAVEPGDGGEEWLRTEIKRGLGYDDPQCHGAWDDQFDAWIAQNYGGSSTGAPVDRPAGLW